MADLLAIAAIEGLRKLAQEKRDKALALLEAGRKWEAECCICAAEIWDGAAERIEGGP